mgnify:CR=1 FL=1
MAKKILIVILLSSFVIPMHVFSSVLILKWKDADFYNEAVKGIESAGINDYTVIDCKGEKDNAISGIKNAGMYEAVIILGETPLKIAVSENLKQPIFYGMVYNPSLIVSNKDNVSGVSLNISFSKQLEIIKQVLPKAVSVGVLYSKDELIANLSDEADKKDMSLKKFKAENDKDVGDKISGMKDVSVILMISDPILSASGVISSLILQSQKIKAPLFVSSDKLVKSGALFGLAPNYFENGKSVGKMVKKYIESKEMGESSDMESGDLYLNLKTAKELKITLSDALLKQAKAKFE